jgi:polar amino acid transport system substrate-binding protein
MHDQIRADSVAANLVLVDTHAAALRLLASGKGDYAIVNTLTGLYSGLELGLTNLVPMGEPVAEVPYGFAFHKGDAALQAKFNQGLAILRNTGRYQQIYGKWLGILEPQTSPWRKAFKYALASLVPLLAIIGAMVVWSWSLRKKIAQYIAVAEARQQELIQSDKLASLGILVSGVAHEINNPTGLILYDLPILQSAYRVAEDEFERHYQEEGDFLIGGLHYSELREEIPRMFDEMLGGARRIRRIVDDLKDFARKDTSSLEEVADLNHVAQAAVRLVDNSIRKATIRFRASYCEGPLPFRGNAQRIEQVVVNLVLNACQALRRPEDSISLSTHRDLRTGDLKLIVEDEGVGIALEHLPHLMDPFFTTRREVGGTGLGLSVSAGIVKDHHGRLEFDSVQGERTTVTLILPTLEAQAHA